jgi:hypothetical protein
VHGACGTSKNFVFKNRNRLHYAPMAGEIMSPTAHRQKLVETRLRRLFWGFAFAPKRYALCVAKYLTLQDDYAILPLSLRLAGLMPSPHPSQPLTPPCLPFRETLLTAARYWEPRRVLYNLILTAIVALWVVASWPHFRPALTWSSLAPMAVLALLANACYTAVYLVDLPLQLSPFRACWRSRRLALWLAGTLLAILLENYWIADEIYPFVR